MWKRSAALASLFVLALFFGMALLRDPSAPTPTEVLRWSQLRGATGHVAPGVRPSEIGGKVESQFYYLLQFVRNNSNLLIYGGIALFGTLMMGLAIAGATTPPKDSNAIVVERLKQEKEKAENLAKLKSEFLNQVSHELRTPLAVIIGYVECITDGLYGELDGKHQEILQVVAKQSSHLKNMIDQILIFSRLDASRPTIRIEEFAIHKIISDLKETFEFLCRQKGLALSWDVPGNLGTIKSDPERVKEILSNLLQNAVKYTDTGSISVQVTGAAEASIVVEVADTGMGIPEHFLTAIFEPFLQVHKTSTENSRGGIGLGLSIVKKHVEQLKGTISVESELGKGSTFKIILPRINNSGDARRRNLLRGFKLFGRRENKPTVRASATNTSGIPGPVTGMPRLN
jgi:signal transduction histidine kinase